MASRIHSLGPHVWVLIAQHLSLTDLRSFSVVSRFLHTIGQSDLVWAPLTGRLWLVKIWQDFKRCTPYSKRTRHYKKLKQQLVSELKLRQLVLERSHKFVARYSWRDQFYQLRLLTYKCHVWISQRDGSCFLPSIVRIPQKHHINVDASESEEEALQGYLHRCVLEDADDIRQEHEAKRMISHLSELARRLLQQESFCLHTADASVVGWDEGYAHYGLYPHRPTVYQCQRPHGFCLDSVGVFKNFNPNRSHDNWQLHGPLRVEKLPQQMNLMSTLSAIQDMDRSLLSDYKPGLLPSSSFLLADSWSGGMNLYRQHLDLPSAPPLRFVSGMNTFGPWRCGDAALDYQALIRRLKPVAMHRLTSTGCGVLFGPGAPSYAEAMRHSCGHTSAELQWLRHDGALQERVPHCELCAKRWLDQHRWDVCHRCSAVRRPDALLTEDRQGRKRRKTLHF